MDADQRFFASRNLPFDQRQMGCSAGAVDIGVQRKITVGSGDGFTNDTLDQRFRGGAVVNEVGNGADFQAMFLGEFHQFRQAGHRAIVVHDLADRGRGFQASHAGEVATGLGVAGANQYATLAGGDRENVAGLDDVVRR